MSGRCIPCLLIASTLSRNASTLSRNASTLSRNSFTLSRCASTSRAMPLPLSSRIRNSTYERLKLLRGGVLSAVLRHILSRDPIAPVLWEKYYDALDRRLEQILQQVEACLSKHEPHYVLVPDELPNIKQENTFLVYIKAFLHSFQTQFVKSRPPDR